MNLEGIIMNEVLITDNIQGFLMIEEQKTTTFLMFFFCANRDVALDLDPKGLQLKQPNLKILHIVQVFKIFKVKIKNQFHGFFKPNCGSIGSQSNATARFVKTVQIKL